MGKEMKQQEGKMCQSCAMPLSDATDFGTKTDGSKTDEYCSYCYENGKFTNDCSMDMLIEQLVPMCQEQFGGADVARKTMKEIFPRLKRWAK